MMTSWVGGQRLVLSEQPSAKFALGYGQGRWSCWAQVSVPLIHLGYRFLAPFLLGRP